MDEIVVMVTVSSEEEATTISKLLVDQRLAACVNVIPGVRSIFQWEGEVVEERETLLVAKTIKQQFERLVATVKAHHSYDVPEIIGLPIQHGNQEYLTWVSDMTKSV